MTVNINQGDMYCGMSVLQFLQSLSLSSKTIKYLKYTPNGISVNGDQVTVRYVLRGGDSITLLIEDEELSEITEPLDVPVDIVYEDSEVLVANKPPFMPTHQSHGHHGDTLANALAFRFQKLGVPFIFRPINRLDRNTSGLVIVAKNKFSAAKLSEAMKLKQIKKSYIAYLDGYLEDPIKPLEYMEMSVGVIDRPIRRIEKSIILRAVCSPTDQYAESALTYYRIIKRSAACTIVEAFPQTGRTHQLRVHFASLGHPIIGDDLYGKKSDLICRHALHARSLTFPLSNPIGSLDKETRSIHLEAPLPEDMSRLNEIFFTKEN